MILQIPDNYQSLLDPVQTERAIKQVKDYFELNLAAASIRYRCPFWRLKVATTTPI